ncbi:MAG: hypothetical protein K8L97_07215 [Anaerolineae bacterium]|nr:hypothetical protein [Anaerolineae bacterium]
MEKPTAQTEQGDFTNIGGWIDCIDHEPEAQPAIYVVAAAAGQTTASGEGKSG